MPNWTRCKINITGCEDDLQKIYNANFSFNLLRPCPFYVNGDYEEDWYEWCCDNWGTKWDVVNEDGELDDNWGMQTIGYDNNVLFANLLTANNPPIELLRYISENMSSVKITLLYYIDGDDECGEVKFEKWFFRYFKTR